MKVKIFDCNHEKDLEKEINDFLDSNKNIEVIDIKFSNSIGKNNWGDEIYCFSALIMYQHKVYMSVAEAEARKEDFEKLYKDAVSAMPGRIV